MSNINLVSENPESTVVSEFQPDGVRESFYQSEAQLEQAFIERLQNQGYEYLNITSETDLIANLRRQLESLNHIRFTDEEWNQFFKKELANPNRDIRDKTAMIQDGDTRLSIQRENGEIRNVMLLDKQNIHNNRLQVINQYVPEGGTRDNRYDVTILVNGLPLVHIELKRRGVDIREAFNQIKRYSRESFWAQSGLFDFIQIFIVSNGTFTKYYSNTTRERHVREMGAQSAKQHGQRSSSSFEFTSWWADASNRPITDLMDFAKTFLAKHTLLNILTKYCVFTSEKVLLVMRPYQIVATERIINRIRLAVTYKRCGTKEAGGYIWHTTGSGKTLTSFKTAQLATRLDGVDKVLFVVDRKDLDYQTMKEYDRFEKNAANSNASTAILKRQLEDPRARIIITTIQKLSIFVDKNKNHPVFQQPIVLIFDECHRSQFGDMHKAIVKNFKKYFLFGFTGTPIFAENSSSGKHVDLRTTEQTFGEKLHTYTIVDAINDKNVLPFRIDYISTVKEAENIVDKKVRDIDREKALNSPRRIKKIVEYVVDHFNQKTKRTEQSYLFNVLDNVAQTASAKNRHDVTEKKRSVQLTGFNSIFAVSSINAAILYYKQFQKKMAELEPYRRLKIAMIYSYAPNGDEIDGLLEEENSESTNELDKTARDVLESAIEDYNRLFQTNYDTSAEKFQNYYRDVSLRMKNREIDLLIVVNMFLTGFDATTLNTLWVDKNLRMHGLLQAYSRTNRILNSIKTFGNIVCFRNLEEATNNALRRFGDKEAGGLVLLRKFDDYYNGFVDEKGEFVPGYVQLIEQLRRDYPVGEPIQGEENQKQFIRLFGAILKFRNVLSVFDQFEENDKISERDLQDYQSQYLDLYAEFRKTQRGDSEDINDDVVFEIELIKQVDINIDYILMLIRMYHDSNMQDKEILVKIQKTIDASLELRNKKDLIENFIASLTPTSSIDEDWRAFVNEKKIEEFDSIIESENLNRDAAYEYIKNAFRDGYIQQTGTALAHVLPGMSRFTPDSQRAQKRETILEKLTTFFNRFRDLIGEYF